ncbi:MAG: redoxin domain-containing protein [Phycisphaerales bacterium]|nr:redoxin domain-containing protein [Phycisphaerales bacterium]
MKNKHLTPREQILPAGSVAPDFTLPDQNRQDWNLAEHVKKGDVALCFFPLAFTGVCGTEMACITKDMETWKKKGASVVAISCDSFAALKAWAEKEGLQHTLLSDMHREVVKGYGMYWPDLNVGGRGTVIIGQSADGKGKVKWSERREPSKAMDFHSVLAQLS